VSEDLADRGCRPFPKTVIETGGQRRRSEGANWTGGLMTDPVAWYDTNAGAVAALYEQVAADAVHSWLAGLLPKGKASVLDVGAGSGRDATWLAAQGHEVIAVEPSSGMRAEASRHHPGAGVRWISDALPELGTLTRSGISFDVILLSAVWMHVAPSERRRAFRKLINLLKPGGLLAMTLRHGPAEPERGIHSVSLEEVEALAREYGAFVETSRETKDALGRDDVRWTQVAIRLPDDGTGALPLLRHVILNDDKSSTYKLALLRVLCRIADGAAGFARDHGEDVVAVPTGLVALTWIRLYKPLLKAGFPQSPSNIGEEKLGFVKGAFRELAEVSHLVVRSAAA
jgi:SAM-dependent methyltransferase